MSIKLVAVTACISGVAHTYMAAEKLEKLCAREKWRLKVETQGALGIDNALTPEDLAQADVLLLITDIQLAASERFARQRCVRISIDAFLRQPEKALSAVRKAAASPQETQIQVV
ncbi:PTS fructose-like transporter subunit IIB [Affinibrenneria salicis]|uniref:protein-N(pi)-phosphohistidine--D-fructose phosphotransferase n=1 Tax=Affinibrenneria salicis TaxID=2590031 RepID=A0A5J5FUZ9_9GAMM|nr:PTS fructose-like transporter subunit IIB [Affinibrenneria salicis]KAA8997283.1 PTS fructose-like transporter subunit IIB [Affinibrenneria salicis]